MSASDRSLMASGIAAAAALVVATVSVTIAVVAYVQPPATVPGTGAPVDRMLSDIWIAPAVSLACALIGIGQVVWRRPVLWSGEEPCRGCSGSWSGVGLLMCVTVLSLVLSMYVIFRSIESQTMSMTDATSFEVLSPGVAVFALVLYWMSDALFKRWWRDARPSAE